jgi:hypothetical protein
MKYKTKYKRLKEHCDNKIDYVFKDIQTLSDEIRNLNKKTVVSIRGKGNHYPTNEYINDVVEAIVEHLGLDFKGQSKLRAEEQDEA